MQEEYQPSLIEKSVQEKWQLTGAFEVTEDTLEAGPRIILIICAPNLNNWVLAMIGSVK